MVYVREFNGRAHDFGVIGVEQGTLIMYDQQTGSWWSQLVGEAVRGPMKGSKLRKLPSTMTTWGKWKQLHPDTTVYVKRSIPYNSRFTRETFARFGGGGDDGPLEAGDWVIAVEGHVVARAYPARRLAQVRVVNDTLEGAPILVFLSEDFASARVLQRSVGERTLTFSLAENDQLKDAETGSLWDPMTGQALSGPLKGEHLQPLVSTYSLWFAWKKYRPDTVVFGEGE